MKKLLLLLITIIGLSFADSLSVNTKYDSKVVTDIYVPQMTLADSTEQYAQSNCYASTPCYGGYSVYCNSYGAGCSWYVQPYSYVTCTGYVGGFWTTVTYSCY